MRWVLQGRGGWVDADWVDLYDARRIKSLPRVNMRIAKTIGAKYRVVLKVPDYA